MGVWQPKPKYKSRKIGTLYLVSTFSIKMLEFGRRTRVEITRLTVQEARSVFNRYMGKGLVVNTIAHKGSAKYMSKVLGVEMQPLKVNIKVKPGDALLVIMPLGHEHTLRLRRTLRRTTQTRKRRKSRHIPSNHRTSTVMQYANTSNAWCNKHRLVYIIRRIY